MMGVEKKTKIVATLGPASSSKEVLKRMIEEGVDVCRINFSHGKHEDHGKVINIIREINKELGMHTAILADLQGPKLRVGEMENNGVELKNGSLLEFTTTKCIGTAEKVYMTYAGFPKDVKTGELVLLDDGKLLLEVVETNKMDKVVAKVLQGGKLSSNKGVNLPNTKISLPSLTEKDLKDLKFALEKNVDWLGLSFVRSARDIIELRHLILRSNKKTKICAKIEKPEAIEEINEIIKETDAIMVARGDLGVEIPMENVPLVQKMIVDKCLVEACPVIIATQMMESMVDNIRPTRAEVNDVANAVMDGADAVMLSGETSVGKHPIEVIKSMVRIVKQVETFEGIYHHEKRPDYDPDRFISDSVCFSACKLANQVKAKAIVTMTHSGYTAFKISSQRPKANIYVFTGNQDVITTLNLVWGVQVFYYDKMVSTDHTIADIKYLLEKGKFVSKGDLIINIASMPIEEQGKSNMIRLSCV